MAHAENAHAEDHGRASQGTGFSVFIRRLPQCRKRPYHSVRVSLPCEMKRMMTMVKALQTYLTENDFLSRLRRLETRGCYFIPMTTDEIALAEHLCNKGVLYQDGIRVRLASAPSL